MTCYDEALRRIARCSLTYSHHDQEAGHKPSKFHDAIVPAIHEVILVLSFAAYPVRYRGDHVGADDEEGEVVLEQGGAEDDQEEAYGEDLGIISMRPL